MSETTDLSIEDVRLAHGISLQRSYKLMQELTDDEYLLEPLKKSVRYAERNKVENATEFAHKLSLILNALAQVHSNGSVVRIIGLGGVVVFFSFNVKMTRSSIILTVCILQSVAATPNRLSTSLYDPERIIDRMQHSLEESLDMFRSYANTVRHRVLETSL